MKKCLSVVLGICLLLASASTLNAGALENKGKEWLEAQHDPAAANFSGSYESDFGVIQLDQAANSRDVTGRQGKYDLVGVVSGKNLYLLFANGHGTVDYCAVIQSDNNALVGVYHYRVTRLRFGHGFCQEKGYDLHLLKVK